MKLTGILSRILLPCVAGPLLGAAPAEYLREARMVKVGGATETWQLIWEGKPRSLCGPEDVEMAVTCPCAGWAYGEMGKLTLVRKRGGKQVERMALGPLFSELPADDSDGLAAMQWRPMNERDWDSLDQANKSAFLAEVRRRPSPQFMAMTDYDHDGQAAEFLIQVSAGPCGHTEYVAVGVSKANPRLHALGSVNDPKAPLVLPGAAWTALAAGGERQVVRWPCGDHGSDEEQVLVLSARDGVIRVRERDYACTDAGARGKLKSDKPI